MLPFIIDEDCVWMASIYAQRYVGLIRVFISIDMYILYLCGLVIS